MSPAVATQGPWTYDPSFSMYLWSKCGGPIAGPLFMPPGHGDRHANGRLMAAAPELRDALRGYLQLAHDLPGFEQVNDWAERILETL